MYFFTHFFHLITHFKQIKQIIMAPCRTVLAIILRVGTGYFGYSYTAMSKLEKISFQNSAIESTLGNPRVQDEAYLAYTPC